MPVTIEVMEGPNGAVAEAVTLEHEGRKFTALGAVIDHANGVLVGYVSADGKSLTKSGGEHICGLTRTGTYLIKSRHGCRTRIFCYGARVDGLYYHGRGEGEGMLLRMRAKVKPAAA